jgi:7,8-dihydro-6-hydroxymethylpterin dimethyltransferase
LSTTTSSPGREGIAPPLRRPTDHIYFTMTKSLCATCKFAVDAKVVFKEDKVFFEKFCPDHGAQETMVSSSVAWYLDALSFLAPNVPPKTVKKDVEKGCPFDCGPCNSHQQKVYLPVIPITSECNLDCPICYTVNKNGKDAHRTSLADMKKIIDHLVAEHDELDIINFTGGEPTLHPQLPEILEMCRDAGIRRLTISTNGLRLLDEALVKRLAAVDARIVLSLDSFVKETDEKLLGANTTKAKLKVLDMLEKHDVVATILPAVAKGLNDKEVPDLLNLVLSRPNIVSLEMHTLCFTGQGGVGFERSSRITIPDLHGWVEKGTEGKIRWQDFVPSPLAHPHCYSISYLLMLDGGGYVPFTRLASRKVLFELLQDSLYIEPRERLEQVFRDIIDRLWSEPDAVPESERVLATIKRLLGQMYPSSGKQPTLLERRRIAERAVKAIYIHSHMDEESFDVARIMKCPVGVPDTDGSNIPTCSYNVLYREKDPRFSNREMLDRMAATRPAPQSPKRALPIAQA